VRESSYLTVRFSGFLQGEYEPHQFLGSVGDGNIVMLTLGSFFSEISGKGRVPKANVLGGVEESKSQVSGAAFLHMGITIHKLS